MLAPAVYFVQVMLALHILAVVVSFGIVFAYPLFMIVGARLDPRAMPWFHRMQKTISRWLVNPGLLLVVIFGVILASKEHVWHAFFVQWGIGAAIVIGGIEGSFIIPRAGRLADIAERDLAGVQPGTGPALPLHSDEYRRGYRQIALAGAVEAVIVIVTVYLMAVQAGA